MNIVYDFEKINEYLRAESSGSLDARMRQLSKVTDTFKTVSSKHGGCSVTAYIQADEGNHYLTTIGLDDLAIVNNGLSTRIMSGRKECDRVHIPLELRKGIGSLLYSLSTAMPKLTIQQTLDLVYRDFSYETTTIDSVEYTWRVLPESDMDSEVFNTLQKQFKEYFGLRKVPSHLANKAGALDILEIWDSFPLYGKEEGIWDELTERACGYGLLDSIKDLAKPGSVFEESFFKP